jgi:chromatin segregation and condensation protein Rec8/ScpA/Scc1 (kleisin family)
VAERQETYEVQIGVFEGPMDLLLYLVQKNEVSPGQISIAEITDQYLTWIRDLSKADLSLAGDFLLMASRLMALKVRELLPKDQQTEAEQTEFEEGREQLMQQMLEYQRFKQVASHLHGCEANHFGVFYRGRTERTGADDDTLADANVWQLFRAFQKTLKVHSRESVHTIELDDVTIEDRQQHINNYLARHGRALFEDLLGRDRRPLVAVVSFMAMLEMIKTDDIVFRQSEAMGAIWLYRRKNNAEFAEEMASEKLRYSSDPDLKPGLVELLRGRETAQESQKRITLDSVMREAVQWASAGKAVSDDVIMGMLEGRVQLQGEVPAEAAPVVEEKSAEVPVEFSGEVSASAPGMESTEENATAPREILPGELSMEASAEHECNTDVISVDNVQPDEMPAYSGFAVLEEIADAGPQAEFDASPLESFGPQDAGEPVDGDEPAEN